MESKPAWTILGPGGGGAQFQPTISPHDPRFVLVACDMTGAYVTHDAGASWRMFSLRQPVRFFVFDPHDPKTVYAQSLGLWRSKDAGLTWSLIYPLPAGVLGVNIAGDHGETDLVTRDGSQEQVTALAIDPTDSQVLYTTVDRQSGSVLLLSRDGGKTWHEEGKLPWLCRRLYIDPSSPRTERALYFCGAGEIARRQGGQWKPGSPPSGEGRVRDMVLGFPSGGGAPRAYAITDHNLLVSDDGGATWHASALPGDAPRFSALATSLHHPEVAYVSFETLKIGTDTAHGVARTADAGHTWQIVWQEVGGKPAENVHDPWMTAAFGPSWAGNPFALGVAPNDPNICYGTDFGRTMRTTDGGKTWQGVYAHTLPDGSYATTGLDVTTCYGVHFDPFDPQRLFLTYTDIGLFRSENGGRGWLPSAQGVPRKWHNTTYWVAFDPEVRGRMWAVMSGTHDLPRPKMWRHRGPVSFNGGVCRSDDGGETWQVSNTGMPETAATHILLDPHSPASARTLYVAAFGRGVYKSTDGGAHWTLKNAGIEGAEPMAWRLTQTGDGTLYLVVARRSEDGSFDNAGDGALYRSTDGAEHWTRVALPRGVNGPNGLTCDPQDFRRLYLAAWGRDANGKAKDGGIFLSMDAGATWSHVLAEDQYIYDVTIDPRDPRTLYACGFSSSVWKSADRGATWQRLRGYNFKWGHRVIPDPQDPHRIYVTTFGGSLWHGPADGDPNASEDILTPALRYSH
ncbi:MAG TPA: hypothetical protein VKU00_17525 [Chthonomonadaceae bacterium]|nr:hypothetical protein [Chthonomonadaceae bacterium]